MALLLKSKDIILRRTCTMPLIGQKNPKGLDIDLRMNLIIKRFSQNQFSVWALERWPGLEEIIGLEPMPEHEDTELMFFTLQSCGRSGATSRILGQLFKQILICNFNSSCTLKIVPAPFYRG